MWRCTVCGYLQDGAEAPENCPKCGAPREKFAVVSVEEADLIERSRVTNSLHMELHRHLRIVADLAARGIADKLDQPCVTIFTRAKEEAETLERMVRAEIRSHVGKGKWG
jgi:rubredoxin